MSPEHSAAVATSVPVVEPTSSAPQHATTTAPQCDNCGAPVADKYCGHCGQRFEHQVHSVLHFTREVTEDLTHADSRLWSTILALLFKPGFLTREFLSGRRVRYLPPLRLYLVLSVLFFLVLGLIHHEARVMTLQSSNGEEAIVFVPMDEVQDLARRPGETPEQRVERICSSEDDGPAFIRPFVERACRKIVGDGRTVSEAFLHNLPRGMFILLPALALVMKAMYRRPRHYYVEHLLFFLHNHAFGFLVFALLMLVTGLLPPAIGKWLTVSVWLYVPYYLFVSLRRVYGQGRWLTFAKLTVLSFAYLICAVITLALTTMYSIYAA